MISISIVDNHNEFLRQLAGALQIHDNFIIKGLYNNPVEALKGLITDEPDIAIIDIQMPKMSGIELISQIRRLIPKTLFLICTSYYDNDNIFNAFREGASGYILKDSDSLEIYKSIIELYNGGSPMSPFIARKIITHFHRAPASDHVLTLTEREQEVLNFLEKGLLYKEIAQRMSISTFTIKNHLQKIYRKLHAQNKVEALNKYKNR